MRVRRMVWLLPLATLASIFCRETTGPSSETVCENHPVTGLELEPGVPTVVFVGIPAQARVSASRGESCSSFPQALTITSSAPGVISGSMVAFGVVELKGSHPGSAKITLSSSGFSVAWTVTVPGPPDFGAIAVVRTGLAHTCVLNTSHQAFCWGIGRETLFPADSVRLAQCVTGPCTPIPVRRAAALALTTLETLNDSMCGLDTQHVALCWSANFAGQAGTGDLFSMSTPRGVAGQHAFLTLGVGNSHACGIDASGRGWCWGGNAKGQVGDSTLVDRLIPVAVAAGIHFASVVAGQDHTCGLGTDGRAWCWGELPRGMSSVDVFCSGWGGGKVGGSSMCSMVPGELRFRDPAPLDRSFRSLTAGSRFTCGLQVDDSAFCWGFGEKSLWNDSLTVLESFAIPVALGFHFKLLEAGAAHVCGLLAGGEAYCWGENQAGQLGDGTKTTRNTPVRVAGGLRFREISSGWEHTCGVTIDGALYCWGANGSGELGSTPLANALVPRRVGSYANP